jgi:predicted phage terminase large subunit-like protein
MTYPLVGREYAAILRQDFAAFVQKCFHHLNPFAPYQHNWHIELMAAKLEAVRRGDIRHLIINVPPRGLKSICASVALPAFCLGHNPAIRILCLSYGQLLADKHAMDCREIMTSSWYQALFPTRLSGDKQTLQEFTTTEQGYRMSTSVGGTLTGRGAHLIIIDDAMKPEEATSDTQRNSINRWFDNSLLSRLDDKARGSIVIVMQRLHEDDLVGHVLSQGKWEVLRLPAIAEEDEEHLIQTRYGAYRHSRKQGEALHLEREPLAVLEPLRQSMGSYAFAGQYLQSPAPLEGAIVKREWFKFYEIHQLPKPFDQIVQSWDSASKAKEVNDYSVCTTWGTKDKLVYLLDVYRKRLEYPDLKKAAIELAKLHEAKVILIEDSASGIQLIQDLKADIFYGATAVKAEGDKVIRLRGQTPMIESGFVHLPREAHWLEAYLHELTTFPNGKYDDQADSTAQALAWINNSGSSLAVWAKLGE